MNQFDYYSILQVGPDASTDEIRAAFKRQALLAHPDRSKDLRATRRMQLINEAYQVLSNRERRALYDQDRAAQVSPTSIQKSSREEPQPHFDPRRRPEQAHSFTRWLRRQMKIIAGFLFLTTLLFGWSLSTGKLAPVVILLLIVQVLYIIASMIFQIKNLVG